MLRNSNFLLCFLLFQVTAKLWAQEGYVLGTVKERQTQKPIAGANIILCQTSDSVGVAFASTNSQGRFRLKKSGQSQSYFIKTTCMGYADTVVFFIPDQWNKLQNIEETFYLSTKTFDIEEVRIVVAVPVKQRGDTTIYKVDSFSKHQEQTLEDVLKRLPNVRVEQNGDVYFKNKKIEKVFIEGDNLSGDKYQTLTRSIDPTLLEEVQAIENFSENKILKSFGGQKETVLNLTIKKERKRLLFGSAELRANPNRADAVATLISFLQKTKQLLIVSGNNVGTERIGSIEPSNWPNTAWSSLLPVGKSLFGNTSIIPRMLQSPLENLNNERVLQYNLASSVTKNTKINIGATAFKDVNVAQSQNDIRFLSDTPFTFTQQDSIRQIRQMQKVHLQLDFNPSSKTSLVIYGSWHQMEKSIAQNSRFFQQTAQKNITQSYQTTQQVGLLRAELTHQINKRNALFLSLNATNSDSKDSYNTNSVAASLVKRIYELQETPQTGAYRQNLTQNRTFVSGQLKWFYADSVFKSQTWVGMAQLPQSIVFNSNLDSTASIGAYLNTNTAILNFAHEGTFRFSRFECSYQFNATHINFSTIRRWYFQPSATITYVSNGQQFWVLNIAQKVNYLDGINLLNAPILNDFRTAQVGNTDLMLNPSTNVSLSYLYNDFIRRKMTILSTFFWNKNRQFWSFNNNVFLPQYSFSTIGLVTNLNSYGLNVNVEKLLYALRGNLKAEFSGLVSQFNNRLNDQSRFTTSRLFSVQLTYLSAFDFPLNFEFSTYHNLNQFLISDVNSGVIQQDFTVSKQKATLFTKIKTFDLSLTMDRNSINQNMFWNFNSILNYAISSKIKASVELKNILDTQKFSYYQLTPINAVSTTYSILPRTVLLGLKYGF